MCDYASLSDTALIELCDELNNLPDADCFSDSRLSQVQTELSRRATDLCRSLDERTAWSCRLDNWSLRVSTDARDLGAMVLAGCVYGHPYFPDGTGIVTSPLEVIVRTDATDLAFTRNSIYELSAAHPDLIRALLSEE